MMAESNREARKAAMQRLKDGDLEGAVELASAALATSPTDAALLMLRGVAQMQSGDWEAGVADLRAAASHKPGDAKIQFNLGNGLVKLGEREEASRAYQAAVLADPGYEPPRLALDKLDPAALRRLDEQYLQVDPEEAASTPAPRPAPAAAPPPLAENVVLGLDGEPMVGAVPAQSQAETPVGAPPLGVGYGRQPSRPAYLPGALSFVRTWFWIVYVLSVIGYVAYFGFLSYAMKQAQQSVTQGVAGVGQPDPRVLDSMPPELRQQVEENMRRREMMGSPEQELAKIKGVMGVFVTGLVISLLVSTVLVVLVSKGLGDGTAWGYWLAMVLSCLGLLQCPLTIGHIVAISNLNKPESKAWCGVG